MGALNSLAMAIGWIVMGVAGFCLVAIGLAYAWTSFLEAAGEAIFAKRLRERERVPTQANPPPQQMSTKGRES